MIVMLKVATWAAPQLEACGVYVQEPSTAAPSSVIDPDVTKPPAERICSAASSKALAINCTSWCFLSRAGLALFTVKLSNAISILQNGGGVDLNHRRTGRWVIRLAQVENITGFDVDVDLDTRLLRRLDASKPEDEIGGGVAHMQTIAVEQIDLRRASPRRSHRQPALNLVPQVLRDVRHRKRARQIFAGETHSLRGRSDSLHLAVHKLLDRRPHTLRNLLPPSFGRSSLRRRCNERFSHGSGSKKN